MISTRLIGWAALITILVAAIFSGFAYEVSPSVFWNWLGTLLATFISVLAAVGVGLFLFRFQTRATDDRERRDLIRLAATELEIIIATLDPDDPEAFASAFVYTPMVEQAARSGLFGPDETEVMVRLSWAVQHYNSLVSQNDAVAQSWGSNPLANVHMNMLHRSSIGARDDLLKIARHVLLAIQKTHPDAF